MLGLSERILGIRTFEHIAQLAETGDLSRVDLTVGDISQIRLSNMDKDTTASNFGRISDVATQGRSGAGNY